MRIVVIGGSGLIGRKLVDRLRGRGQEVVAASPSSGVDTVTGRGLPEALAGAEVVVDVANAPSFEPRAVLEVFETAGRNLLAAEAAAGVRHHLALSVVGTDRLPENGYFQAKLAQERLIEASGIPYTIVRSTQFIDFLGAMAEAGAEGEVIRLSTASLQPIASDDVAEALAEAALGPPVNGRVEIAGPERLPLHEAVRRVLAAGGDRRAILPDPKARYFGAVLEEDSLVPARPARLGAVRIEDWLARAARQSA